MDIFSRIPIVLYKEIKNYLAKDEYLRLVNSSKECFENIKYETIEITLFTDEIKKFFSDQDYQTHITRSIHSFEQQLIVILDNSVDSSILQKLSTLPISALTINAPSLRDFPDWIQLLSNKRYLELNGSCEIANFKGIHSLKRINMRGIRKLNDLSHFIQAGIIELKMFGMKNLINLNPLSKLYKLEISFCHAFSDVSCLSNIPDLTVVDCFGIKDISSLQNNYKLQIRGCYNIHPFSKKNFQKIKILETDLIISYQDSLVLQSIQSVSLRQFLDATIYLPSKTIRKLVLFDNSILSFEFVKDLPYLNELWIIDNPVLSLLPNRNNPIFGQIPIIGIISCPNLVFIPIDTFQSTYSITITGCQNLDNFEFLCGIPKVFINECDSFSRDQDISFPSQQQQSSSSSASCSSSSSSIHRKIHYLTLKQCHSLKNVSSLSYLQELELIKCSQIISLKGLFSIPRLKIYLCSNLQSLQDIGGNEKVMITEDDYFRCLRKDCPRLFAKMILSLIEEEEVVNEEQPYCCVVGDEKEEKEFYLQDKYFHIEKGTISPFYNNFIETFIFIRKSTTPS